MVAGNLSIEFNLRGPNLAMVTACTTGTHSIGLGADSLRPGCGCNVGGGAEMGTTPVGLGGFAAAERYQRVTTILSTPRGLGTKIETDLYWVMAPV